MKVTIPFVYDKIAEGLNRALPALIIAMFMMVIASLESGKDGLVVNFALGSSICFAALSAFLIWEEMDHKRTPFWQNLAVIFFATGFLLFILTIFSFYYEIIFG
jgi:hypothetical protein